MHSPEDVVVGYDGKSRRKSDGRRELQGDEWVYEMGTDRSAKGSRRVTAAEMEMEAEAETR